MVGALDGLRVLEVGGFVSAPYCTKLLADLGADVIKVEPPDGDPSRRYGPFRDDREDPECSGLYLYLNTNKRGITLDISSERGREVLRGLLGKVDVVVENLEPDEVEARGLDYASLSQEFPGLVVASISAFGRSGPHAHYRGHGLQASAGSTVAYRTGDPERSPLSKPLNEPEFLGGLHAAAALMLAVLVQKRDGVGQHIDISMQDVLTKITSGPMLMSATYGTRMAPRRSGHRVNAFYPWTVLPVADGYMEFITMQDRQWNSFMEEIGSPEWASDERFQNRWAMSQYADELEENILAAVSHRTRADLWKAFRDRRVSFQPVLRVDEVVESDHLKERQYFQQISDGDGGTVTVPGAPYKLSGTPWELRKPAPRLGEHTEEVLSELLGLTQETIADLQHAGSR